MKQKKKVIVSEHVLEVRHQATGRFLDVRGNVADHVRGSDMFPHWQIKTNVIAFSDAPDKPNKVGAFAGFKSAGLFAYDPDTRNFFQDKCAKYWKILASNQFYTLPELLRFGCRTKVFLNSDKSFEQINKDLTERFFSDRIHELDKNPIRDFQIVLEFVAHQFQSRIVVGPIHKEEADKYFSFESDHFSETGLYLDIDIFKTRDLQATEIPALTNEAMDVTWGKIDAIANMVEL